MTEEQIINAIADACEDDTLRFQIIIQDGVLYVYINRPADAELDHQDLEAKINTALKEVKEREFQEIALYSRVLGETEPDWQSLPETEISRIDSGQISSMMSAITDAVEATNSIVDRIERELTVPESLATSAVDDFDELPTTAEDKNSEFDLETIHSIESAVTKDLKQYCFIRNQRLLYAVLAPPKQNIAQLIDLFHLFGEPIQRSQMPILEEYFDRSTMPELGGFEPEVQSWWTAIIMLDSDQKRQFTIWLSRYCIHPEQTTITINEVLQPKASPEDSNFATSDRQKPQDTDNFPKSDRHKPSLIANFKNILHKLWGDRQSDRTE